jgi:hypothetical protein
VGEGGFRRRRKTDEVRQKFTSGHTNSKENPCGAIDSARVIFIKEDFYFNFLGVSIIPAR